MQTKTWVRVGLATVIATAACGGMTMAGCGGDDNSGTPPKKDSGGDVTTSEGGGNEGGNEGGGTEGGHPEGGDSGPTTPNAKVYIIHAASDPNAPPLRFCFGLNSSPDGGGTVTVAGGIPPFPDTKVSPLFPIAGLFPGFGGSTAGSAKLAAYNLGQLTISLYAIDATKIANDTAAAGPDGGAEVPCEGLIGTDAKGAGGAGGGTLTLGTDYYYLGTIPSCAASPNSCLASGQTWVAAVTGCFPGEAAGIQPFCPAGYSAATGDLGITAWRLDNTTAVDATHLGAQYASASSAWDTVVASASALGAAGTAAGFWSVTVPEAGVPEAGAGDGGTDAATDAGSPPPTPVFNFIPIAGPPSTGFGHISSPVTILPTGAVVYDPSTAGFASAIITADGGSVLYPPATCNPAVAGTCISPLLYPLPIIDELSGNVPSDGGPPNGSTYAGGKSVAFILVGDPANQMPYIGADGGGTTTPTAVPNGKFAHFLAFPTSNP